MKKIKITIALMLVFALAMPAFGASFPDVPGNHWAYEAINKLVASGVVEGYPDGEYKGQRSMTRYEMAVIISRALDNIMAEQEAMAREMEAMGEGLTTGQAEDVTAIVKSLMEKNTNENLSDSQAQQVADIVDALTFELRAELRVLGADVDALYDDMDVLEAKVDALDIPEDNIEWAADVSAVFEASDYGDNPSAAAILWADSDLLDLATVNDAGVWEVVDEDGNVTGTFNTVQAAVDSLVAGESVNADLGDFPSEKNFYQEYNFIVKGDVSGAEFNLNIDALSTYFADAHGEVFGDTSQTGVNPVSDSGDFKIDSALLEVAYNDTNVKVGNMDDYHVERYFADEIGDARGLEATTSYYGFDFKGLILGEGDTDGDDYYGLVMSRDLDIATVTGKLYQVRGPVQNTKFAGEISDFGVAENVVMGAEVVYDYDYEDFFATANVAVQATDELTVNGKVEYAGPDFTATGEDQGDNDLEEAGDYILANLNAEYMLDENNTLLGGYTFVTTDTAAADKHRINAGIENTYGDFDNYANVEYTINDEYNENNTLLFIEADTEFDLSDRINLIAAMEYETGDATDDYTLAKIGADYMWNETTTVGAAYQYKTVDAGLNYNYLEGTLVKELHENVSWDTTAKYLMGETSDGVEGVGSTINTALTVSF